MRKAYTQPEVEVLSLASLDDFLVASPEKEESFEVGIGGGGFEVTEPDEGITV